ncbi:sarcosine oxidase subunit gamma [Tropicimonas marinistellae]|uniref:sarcosine oxidase subunit gamma n=1 Tax=Tropicimonas marinistellae TaxID=1739787 RepID=UPI00082D5B24|nr:hypothetical protein [Tropicimonas marinistellae]
MAKYRLTPWSPFGQDSAAAEIGPFALMKPDLALTSVAGVSGTDVEQRLADVLGARPPGPGGFVQTGNLGCFWMGARLWMVFGSRGTCDDLTERLETAMQGAAAVVEQSDGWVGLDVTGQGVSGAFERLVCFDIHEMRAGEVQRSVIEHVGCIVFCLAPDRHMRVLAPRSYARALRRTLVTCLKATLALHTDE